MRNCVMRAVHCRAFAVVVVLMLGAVFGVNREVESASYSGFDQDCSLLTQDPLLGALWPGNPGPGTVRHAAAWAAMVPRLSLSGTALATYDTQRTAGAASTLETLFGVSYPISLPRGAAGRSPPRLLIRRQAGSVYKWHATW
jgi:hypothetical protein